MSIPMRPSAPFLRDVADSIPTELLARPQWVVWRYELKGDRKKWTKVPYKSLAPDEHASSTDSETWSTFEEALHGYEKRRNRKDGRRIDGIGFVFAPDDPYVGIDFDRCLDHEGNLLEWAKPFLSRLLSYAEVSPSGLGVKVIARGSLPGAGRKKTNVGSSGGAVEMYDKGRFFTVTGIRYADCPTNPMELSEAVLEVHNEIWPGDTSSRPLIFRQTILLTDNEILARAFASKSGDRIKALYRGDTSGHGSNDSDSDMALCCHLAFWFGRDSVAVDRVFRTSELMRKKWDEKRGTETYGSQTIAKAIDWTGQVFSPPVECSIIIRGRKVVMGTAAGPVPESEDEEAETAGLSAPSETYDDPFRLARVFFQGRIGPLEFPSLWFWRDEWHTWDGTRYIIVPESELRADLTTTCKTEFDQAASVTDKPSSKITRSLIGNVLGCLESIAVVPQRQCPHQPAWLDANEEAPDPIEVLPARNGLIHLPSMVAGKTYLIEPTPRFFSPNCLDYDFVPDAPRPDHWLEFLTSLWPDDPESIACLQEWFGYLLIPDTSMQKMLAIIGPPRSGKGTIARVLSALVGHSNVSSPALSSMANNFGVAPLIGKTVAIFPDARLSGRQDGQVVVERLLSISGEDDQTIDRKHLTSWTGRLTTRFVLLSNELPRLGDSSGAITSRTVILKLTRSFLGSEDTALGAKLTEELPSILLWSVIGWARLRARNRFLQPASGQELLDELQELSSPVGQFVEERCEIGADLSSPVKALYGEWKAFCTDHGKDHPGDEQGFGRALRAAVPTLKMRRPREDGKRVREYMGIGLKENF